MKMGNMTDGNWKVVYNCMVVAVSLEGVNAEASRTYGGGRIICKFFHSSDGALIVSAPEMQREFAHFKRRMLNGQNALMAATDSSGAMISVSDCLESFGFDREDNKHNIQGTSPFE